MKNSEPAKPLRQPRPLRHLRASDLRATAQLATQATQAVASTAEGVHQSVWHTLGLPGAAQPGTTRGLTGMVYRSVSGVATLIGHSATQAPARLEPMLQRLAGQPQ